MTNFLPDLRLEDVTNFFIDLRLDDVTNFLLYLRLENVKFNDRILRCRIVTVLNSGLSQRLQTIFISAFAYIGYRIYFITLLRYIRKQVPGKRTIDNGE